MVYVKQLWVDDDGSGTTGSPFDAERMNHIEDGIEGAAVVGPPGPPGGAPAQYVQSSVGTAIDPALGFVQIADLTLVAPAAASYNIQVVLDIEVEGANGQFSAYLFVNGAQQVALPFVAHDRTNAGATLDTRTTVAQQWTLALAAGDTVSIKADAATLWANCSKSCNLMMYTAGAGPKGDKGDQGDQGPAGDNAAIPMDTWHVVGAVGEPAFGANVIAVSLTDVESEPTQATPAFRKFPNGVVQLRGAVRLTAAGTGAVIFTLPVGYRPPAPVVVDSGNGTGGTTVQIKILANGRILIPGAIANYLLDGLVFDTETVVNMPSGPKGDKGDKGDPGSGAGHVIQDEGVTLTQRAKLNFKGASVTVTDDPANDASAVTFGAAAVPIDPWHTVGSLGQPAFGTGYRQYAAFRPVGFCKNPLGRVELKGLVECTSAHASGDALFTLPAGYRPTSIVIFDASHNGLSPLDLRVDVLGNVYYSSSTVPLANGSYISLDALGFDTETVTQMPTGPAGPTGATGPAGGTMGAAAVRGSGATQVDVAGTWRNVPFGSAALTEPSDAFTIVGGAIVFKDAGWYRLSAGAINPVNVVNTLYLALSTSATPGDGDIANNVSQGVFVRTGVSGNAKVPAGGIVYLHAWSSSAAPVNVYCQQFAVERIGGPQGPAGAAGSISGVQDEGSLLAVRSKLNIIGSNIRAVDDPANDRINIIGEIPLVTALTAGAQGIPNPIPNGFMADLLMTAPDTTIAMWRFRYRSTSPSAYKWECISGVDIHSYGGNLPCASTSAYIDLSVVQNFICPIEAEYLFRWGCQTYNTVGAANHFMALWNFTANTVAAELVTFAPAINTQVAMSTELKVGLAIGTDIRTRYHTSGGSGQFLGRYLAMRPVRAP